jgi:hypothetical protein
MIDPEKIILCAQLFIVFAITIAFLLVWEE